MSSRRVVTYMHISWLTLGNGIRAMIAMWTLLCIACTPITEHVSVAKIETTRQTPDESER